MKSYTKVLFGLFLIMVFTSCAGGPGPQPIPPDDPWQAAKDECQTLVNSLTSSGGAVAAIGVAESKRRDIAERKATLQARKELAESFSTKVQNLAKLFTEEVGSGEDTEINELFSDAMKSVTDRQLTGSTKEKTKMVREDKDGSEKFHCFVVVSIKANSVYASFDDELKNKDTKTYERFRASQAYDELEAELK